MMGHDFILKHAAQLSSGSRGSKYSAILDLCQCLEYVSSNGSGKTSVCAVTGRVNGMVCWSIITNQYTLLLRVCEHVYSANLSKHSDMVYFDIMYPLIMHICKLI